MELNKRQIHILRQLLLDEKLNVTQFAKEYSCSTKTIQRDFKAIEEAGKKLGFSLKMITGQGVILECDSSVRNQLENIVFATDQISISVERRRNLIYLDLLLNSPSPTNIRSLSEKYYVGSSSIVNDLAIIEQRAHDNGISMHKTREGTYLSASELVIRNEVAFLLSQIPLYEANEAQKNTDTRLNSETRMVLEGIYGYECLSFVEKCVSNIEESIDVILQDTYYVNIVTHILIAVERMKNKSCIREDEVIEKNAISNVIYDKIKECIEDFSKKAKITFPEIEIQYIYTHFMGCGVGELPSREVIALTLQANKEVLNFCNEMIQAMENMTGYSFTKDSNLFYSLLLHVNSLITRIKYNVRIICLLKEKTMLEFPQMFHAVKSVTQQLNQKYYPDKYISDDEIAYLCILFCVVLEQKKEMKKVLLVCSTGLGTSHLLKRKIEKTFPDVEIVDMISTKQLKTKDFSEIDVVLTTVKFDFRVECPVVTVSVMLNQKDIDEIKRYL